MSVRLTVAQVAALRAGVSSCELCGEPFSDKNPKVCDHDHTTGAIRGVLHRGCNAMLGVIENGRARYLLTDPVRLGRMLGRIMPYILKRRDDAPLYPTHRSADEKRLLRNKRARAARVKKA